MGEDLPSTISVVVHDLSQAHAVVDFARSLGARVRIVSAPYVAAFAGVAFVRALEEQLGVRIVADCGKDAGLVMAALRTGLRDMLFAGDERLRQPLAEMASAVGGCLRFELEEPVIRLEPGEDAVRRLQRMPG
jgi:hypothetical protein